MQVESPDKIRNLAIAGHSDTGKTTLVSSLLYARTRQNAGGIAQEAIAAIENALLDIKAKALGVPVYELFGGPARTSEARITQREMDLAASVQDVTEEIVLRLTRSIAAENGTRNLCLAGGVALNCVANGKVLRDGKFDNIWVQPAAGDAGGALGAALAAYHLHQDRPRVADGGLDAMSGGYLGPGFDQAEVARRLAAAGARFEVVGDEALIERAAAALEAAFLVAEAAPEAGPLILERIGASNAP